MLKIGDSVEVSRPVSVPVWQIDPALKQLWGYKFEVGHPRQIKYIRHGFIQFFGDHSVWFKIEDIMFIISNLEFITHQIRNEYTE